jgi:hypothetical protein
MRLWIGIGIGFVLASVIGLVGYGQADCPDQPCDSPPCCNGDANGDGVLNVSDVIYLCHYLYINGPEPLPIAGGGALPATGQTLCYDALGNEIDCHSVDCPGQDSFYQNGCPMEGRFVDNGDGTVTDKCTGLTWQQATPLSLYTWGEALQHCEDLDFAGHDDWRLPNIIELQSIVDYAHFKPAIFPVFDAIQDWYWSSSSDVFSPYLAWGVHFSVGIVINLDKSGVSYVRAVRG